MEAQLGWRRPPTLASAGQYRVRCLDRMQGGVRRGMSPPPVEPKAVEEALKLFEWDGDPLPWRLQDRDSIA